jgi:hypothetical protein
MAFVEEGRHAKNRDLPFMMMRSLPLCLAVLMFCGKASAEIYACEKNGVKEFSQKPCGESAVVLKTEGDDSIRIVVPMPDKDVQRVCRLVVRAWEQAGVNRTNSYSSSWRYRRATSSQERTRDYVFSRISNLPELARDYPSLYRLIDSLASRATYNSNPGAYTYQAERDTMQIRCEEDFLGRLQEIYRQKNR